MFSDVFVGIFAVGHAQHLDRRPRRARDGKRAKRRLLSRSIAVIAEAHLRRIAQQELRLLRGKRRAKRGNDVLYARSRDGNRIHIALDDDGESRARNGAMRAIETEEQTSLVEDQRLGRIQIFRLAVSQDASAERHHAPSRVADRDDHAIAKAVVMTRALLPLRRQAALFKERSRHAALLEGDGELVPRGRRIADAESLDDALADAAPREVGLRRLAVMRLGQTVVKKGLRHLMHAAKFLRLLVTRDFRCASLSLGQRNIELFRLQFDCLEIGDVLDKREELEYVPSDVTAETIKKSLLGNHRKRRCVLVVKRAAAPITISFFL